MMDSKTYKAINEKLDKAFGKNRVKLVPDSTYQYEYCLRFNDDVELSDANVLLAKSIINAVNPSQWFDNEIREVEEW